jgi:hypothetical protein
MLPVIVIFLFMVLSDTIGTLIGVGVLFVCYFAFRVH